MIKRMESLSEIYEKLEFKQLDDGNYEVVITNDENVPIKVSFSPYINQWGEDSIGSYNFSLDIKSLFQLCLDVDFCFENWDTTEWDTGFINNDVEQHISIDGVDTFIEFINLLLSGYGGDSPVLQIDEVSHPTWVIHDIIKKDCFGPFV